MVRLKSGGQELVVVFVENQLMHHLPVCCAWLDTSGAPHEQHFPAQALVHATLPGPAPKEKTEKEKMAEAMDEAAQLERMRFAHTEGY